MISWSSFRRSRPTRRLRVSRAHLPSRGGGSPEKRYSGKPECTWPFHSVRFQFTADDQPPPFVRFKTIFRDRSSPRTRVPSSEPRSACASDGTGRDGTARDCRTSAISVATITFRREHYAHHSNPPCVSHFASVRSKRTARPSWCALLSGPGARVPRF